MRALNVIMLGPPGAGKGTQAARLARDLAVPKISTGDILREAVQAGTPLGLAAKGLMDAGRLVSDDIMIGIVRERLQREDARRGVVLDGFPRTLPQAVALDEMVKTAGELHVLFVKVPFDELVRRLTTRRICGSCGTNAPPEAGPDDRCPTCGGRFVQRTDDDGEVVKERLRVYERQTGPLVAHYESGAHFTCIDGNQSLERVADDIRRAVRTGGSAEEMRRT
ncbi:MAG: adenylate kinase [Vicinamibacterales bacterium]